MIKEINRYKRTLSFLLRKKITKKYVIIESDDWGLERAKDEHALQNVIKKYGKQNTSRWTDDALETIEDLDQLFDLLASFKDKFRKGPILTANFLTHNIDYSSKSRLKFRPISEGYNFADEGLFEKYSEGIDKKFFFPQLHGFCHYQTSLLEQDFESKNFMEDFEAGFPLAKSTIKGNLSRYRGECFDPKFKENIVEAIKVFKNTFGYYSRTFIPPNYLYTDNANSILSANHIELLQSTTHLLSVNGNSSLSPLFRKKKGLFYSARRARLDTHSDYNYLADICIQGIEIAFSQHMPAVIDIHRVNFSGRYSPKNRQKTLKELKKVFSHLHQNHPDTIFITSDALIDVLKNNSEG